MFCYCKLQFSLEYLTRTQKSSTASTRRVCGPTKPLRKTDRCAYEWMTTSGGKRMRWWLLNLKRQNISDHVKKWTVSLRRLSSAHQHNRFRWANLKPEGTPDCRNRSSKTSKSSSKLVWHADYSNLNKFSYALRLLNSQHSNPSAWIDPFLGPQIFKCRQSHKKC